MSLPESARTNLRSSFLYYYSTLGHFSVLPPQIRLPPHALPTVVMAAPVASTPTPNPSPNRWQGFVFALHTVTVAWGSLGARAFPTLTKQTIDHFFTMNSRNCHSSSHITAHVTLSSLELNLPGSP